MRQAGPATPRQAYPLLRRSVRRRDREHLSSRDHEIVRMARVPDFGETCVQRCPQHGRRIVGAQFKPRAEPGLLIIWCVVGEFDAEMAAARKADKEHGLVDPGKRDRLYRAAAKDGLKAPSQFLASMGRAKMWTLLPRAIKPRPALPLDQ